MISMKLRGNEKKGKERPGRLRQTIERAFKKLYLIDGSKLETPMRKDIGTGGWGLLGEEGTYHTLNKGKNQHHFEVPPRRTHIHGSTA